MKMKLAALATILVMALTACSQGTAAGTQYDSDTVKLPDGTTVICVFTASGGTSCDWNDK